MSASLPVRVDGPCFDELRVGDRFDTAPALTLTAGHAAVHQAIAGDRLPLTLDHELSRRVAGDGPAILHPALVWDVAIGQSTLVTRNVVANLFYEGLAFRRFPREGDTLRTATDVVALRQNRAREGRHPTGLAVLRIRTEDQHGRAVLDFRRCAMLPLRDASAQTGHTDDVHGDGGDDDGRGALTGWRLGAYGAGVTPSRPEARAPGTRFEIAGADVVSSAPELARLTLNIARVHHDGGGDGEQLVYGGHTVALALAQASRALPELVIVTAWRRCDHPAPVRPGDLLRSVVTVESVDPLEGDAVLATLRSEGYARHPGAADEAKVLDWTFSAVLA